MEKNLRKINPELESGDRIMLLHMDGEPLETGVKGKVIKKTNMPKFTSSDLGYLYEVEWYDDGKVISKLSLIPETDGWSYDVEYYMNN